MPKLKFNPRRPLGGRILVEVKPEDDYLESDKDFVANNLELAVELLEEYGKKNNKQS